MDLVFEPPFTRAPHMLVEKTFGVSISIARDERLIRRVMNHAEIVDERRPGDGGVALWPFFSGQDRVQERNEVDSKKNEF